MVRLRAGTPAWRRLLRQEGVPFDTGMPGPGTAVLVLDTLPEPGDHAGIRDFLARGGALLAAASHAAPLLSGVKIERRRLRALVPDGSVLFSHVGAVHLDTVGDIPRGANAGSTGRTKAVYFGPLNGAGPGVLLPFELDPLLAGTTTAFRVFPAATPRPVSEAVARVNRGELRRIVGNCLRWLLGQRGLPYVRLARTPFPTDSGFGLRVDTDFDSAGHLAEVAGLAAQAGIRATWFVNTEAHAGDLRADVAALRDHDIQVHCHRHTVFPGFEDNLANMSRALEALRAAGVSPEGAAGPFGEWNPSWDRALAQLGLGYSSDFAAGYDDIPFRPMVDGAESAVLQVPVHPVSPGRLLAAHADGSQVLDYFRRHIDRQAARQEPCFIYGHPANLARLAAELRDIITHGTEACGGWMTLTDYARWWQVRERVRCVVRVEDGTLAVEAARPEEVELVVERRGDWSRIPLRSGRFDLDEMPWRPVPEPVGYTPDELAFQVGRHWGALAREMLRSARRQTTA